MFGKLRQSAPEPEPVNIWVDFEEAAMPHMESLFRIAMWRVRDRPTAEDLVQETMTEALKSFHRFERGTNIHAWLVTIISHLESKRRRKFSRLQFVSDEDHQIAETVAFIEPIPEGLTDEEVLAAFGQLSPNYSQVVMLADVEDLSYKEIAEALKIPIGTVMSRLNRGRQMLRRELAGYAVGHGLNRASHI